MGKKYMPMEMYMKANGKMIKEMGKENIYGQLEIYMKEIGKIVP